MSDRKYTDFTEYFNQNLDSNIVEMDAAEGFKEESNCFLTLLWRKSRLMFIFKLAEQTTTGVKIIFHYIQDLLQYDTYCNLIQIIHTYNGQEFLDVNNIECIYTGEKVTNLYFCDPYRVKKGMSEKIMNLYDIFTKESIF